MDKKELEQSEQAIRRSFDSSARLYDIDTDTFHHQISFYVTLQNFLQKLPLDKDTAILDSGGGAGKYSVYLKNLGYNVTLADISKNSIDEANKKAAELELKLSTVVCNSENTPFTDGAFAFVMMNGGVISYTPSPDRLLEETHRILKPGDTLWLDFLNALGWAMESPDPELKPELALKDDRLIKMPDWEYPARLMSIKRIKSMLIAAGFKIESKYGLILLSNSLPLNERYSTNYDKKLVDKYKNVELILSRKQECVGSSWSIIADPLVKTNNQLILV